MYLTFKTVVQFVPLQKFMYIFVCIWNLESFYEEKFVSEENETTIIPIAIGIGDNDDDPNLKRLKFSGCYRNSDIGDGILINTDFYVVLRAEGFLCTATKQPIRS